MDMTKIRMGHLQSMLQDALTTIHRQKQELAVLRHALSVVEEALPVILNIRIIE
jgi:hypothetical protein